MLDGTLDTNAPNHFDVLIVGGGMVGASMAVAIQPLGLKVGLVEAFPFKSAAAQPAYDDRSVALSYGSSLIYQGMQLWGALQSRVEAIQSIHVSDKGYFGAARLHADKENVAALGYVVESRVLGRVLYEALQSGRTTVLAPAKVATVSHAENDRIEVTIEQDGQLNVLSSRLLIVADGANSAVREQLGITVRQHDYGQSALIANVSTSQPHQNAAYERFTANGPLALLPMTANRYSLVWTHRSEAVDETLQLDDEAFLKKLQAVFGYRQGRFIKVGQRQCYPLSLVKSLSETARRAVVIGNASHALHPVAGQGLNLALRDVAVLSDLLAEAVKDGRDVGDVALLEDYERLRKPDLKTVVNYTDGLVRLFSLNVSAVGHARAGGLLAVDRVPLFRKLLTTQSMGLRYRQSRLARGLGIGA